MVFCHKFGKSYKKICAFFCKAHIFLRSCEVYSTTTRDFRELQPFIPIFYSCCSPSCKNCSMALFNTCACGIPVCAHLFLNCSANSFGMRMTIDPYTLLL